MGRTPKDQFRIFLVKITARTENVRANTSREKKEKAEPLVVSAPGSRPRFRLAGWGYAPFYQNSGQLGAGGSGDGGPGGNVGPSLE